jgi:dTDP-4-dehydrorhamnose reductase
MIILFGSNGYIGSEFATQLKQLNVNVIHWKNTKNTTFNDLQCWYHSNGCPKIEAVINAAGYTGKPNVDSCEIEKTTTIHGNIIWTQILTNWCMLNNILITHISSGCIYNGKKDDGSGFSEQDEPNFTWKQNNCSFYSGSKVVGENIISQWSKHYICRLRIPFEENHNNRNYLSKLLNYNQLLNAENSISNKNEFVNAVIQMIRNHVPFGIYNITNTGHITTEEIVKKLKKTIAKNKQFNFITEKEFYSNFAIAPRSNCIINNSKLLSLGIKMRPVDEAIDYCLTNWKY